MTPAQHVTNSRAAMAILRKMATGPVQIVAGDGQSTRVAGVRDGMTVIWAIGEPDRLLFRAGFAVRLGSPRAYQITDAGRAHLDGPRRAGRGCHFCGRRPATALILVESRQRPVCTEHYMEWMAGKPVDRIDKAQRRFRAGKTPT